MNGGSLQSKLGLAAEHGFFVKPTSGEDWEQLYTKGGNNFAWKEMVEPILEVYKDSTDGSYIERKDSALVWHYQNADPDFGSWQVCAPVVKHMLSSAIQDSLVLKHALCYDFGNTSTDGSYIERKDSALVWHYQDADPDLGSWQVCSSRQLRAPEAPKLLRGA